MAEDKDPNAESRPEVTTHLDGYHRHGDPDSSKWQEAEVVTDRPNDIPPGSTVTNSTLASRAKARSSTKQVSKDSDEVQDKKVSRRRTAKK